MLFLDEGMKDPASPPSYTEAIHLPAPRNAAPPAVRVEEDEALKPKLCKMQKTPGGYGFHLNGIQGVCGQHIQQVNPNMPHAATRSVTDQTLKK